MKLSDFDFELPANLIATHPVEPRDAAKMMVADRGSGKIIDLHFYDLPDLLQEGDFLVFNSSRVIPARLFGKVDRKDVEILLISPCHSELDLAGNVSSVIPAQAGIQKDFIDSRLRGNDDLKKSGMTSNIWQVMARPGKRLKLGSRIRFELGLEAEVVEMNQGASMIRFNLSGSNLWQKIEELGEMPLPPYILKARRSHHDEEIDKADYQTVYADRPGSVAAPTAGLHFTKELMQKIQDKGCEIGFVDLHVGLGTFEPIRTENIEDHKIHSEYFELSHDLAARLNKAKNDGRRIIAVGTTTVRVLETCPKNGILEPKSGETDIYIYPGYEFGFADAMITNFHLPKSSLLLLVSAFWEREKLLESYNQAIQKGYRFYTYGDGMLII